MTSHEIERRLRLPAPDEPAVLPALVLPSVSADPRGVRLRIGAGEGAPRFGSLSPRLVLAMVALVVAMVGAIATGALLLDHTPNPFDRDAGLSVHGVHVDYPGGWIQVAARNPFGDSGAATFLIVSNVGVDGCTESDVAYLTPPTPMMSGTDVVMPPSDGKISDLEDRILACVAGRPLARGEIRVSVTRGIPQAMGVGPIESYDPAAWHGTGRPTIGQDAWLPTAEDGWDRVVDGMPAKLVVNEGSPAILSDEVRTWAVWQPGYTGEPWYVKATLRGPDLDALRAEADRIAQSIRFDARPAPLDVAGRDAAVARAIDALDRENREFFGTTLIGCFPRTPGERPVTLQDGPEGPLLTPVEATCATAVEPTLLHLWRVALTVSWPAGDGYPAGSWGGELLVDPDPARDGRASGGIGHDPSAMFPGTTGPLPSPLADDLVIPIGSVVRLLPPGLGQTGGPIADLMAHPDDRIGDRILYDAVPGRRFYVVDGPLRAVGTDWYQVEAHRGSSYGAELTWIPATDGDRPLLEVVDPACPATVAVVTDLVYIHPAERLLCYGDRELVLGPATAVLAEPGTFDTWVDGEPAWLAKDTQWRLYGAGGPDGVDGSLAFAIAPSLGETIPTGTWLTVRGHFDDPAAATCRRTYPPEWGAPEAPPIQQLRCRELFVVTSFERRSAP